MSEMLLRRGSGHQNVVDIDKAPGAAAEHLVHKALKRLAGVAKPVRHACPLAATQRCSSVPLSSGSSSHYSSDRHQVTVQVTISTTVRQAVTHRHYCSREDIGPPGTSARRDGQCRKN